MLTRFKQLFSHHKTLVLSFVFFFVFSGVLSVFAAAPSGGYAPNATLDPDCAPGDTDCVVDLSTGGDSLWSLASNDTDIFFDGGLVGIGIDSPVANLHILATQTLVPGTPAIPGTVGDTSYTGAGLDDATFGGQYDGIIEDCEILAGIQDLAPGNGFANDRFIFGLGGGPGCNGGGGPLEITPGVPQNLVSGITITFASGTGHTLLEMSPLNENWAANLTVGTTEIPDSYIAGDDPFLITNEDDDVLFKVSNDGNITLGAIEYTFPSTVGTDNYVLTTDGVGVLTWEEVVSSGGFTIDDTDLNMFAGTNAGGALTDGVVGNNLFIGINSGTATSSGTQNTFIGNLSGRYNTTGTDNTFVGLVSGYSNTIGVSNTFLGTNAGYLNTTGSGNTFLGNQSGFSNTTGDYNIFTGVSSGESNISGSHNIFSGNYSGFYNTIGSNNIFLGFNSGRANTSSDYNVFIGYNAGYNFNGLGGFNTFLGTQAGQNNTVGYYNLFSGYNAGVSSTTGFHNTIIGSTADVATGNTSNAVALGYGAIAETNQFALPDDVTSWKFSGDSYILPISGAITTAGVLTNDGSGNLTWASAGGGSSLFTLLGTNLFDSRSGNGTMTGVGNFFVGTGAGVLNDTGVHNIFTGSYAGTVNTSGSHNIFSGYESGYSNVDGIENVFIGVNAGYSNVTGDSSVFIGAYAGKYQLNDNLIAIGKEALQGSTTSGFNIGTANIAIGRQAGFSNTSGSNNLYFGDGAGGLTTEGGDNIFMGYGAGASNVTGDYNFVLGHYSTTGGTDVNNSIILGYNNSANGFNNTVIFGSGETATAPNQMLWDEDITTLRFQGDTYTLPTTFGAIGSVLTDTDGAGDLSWVVPSGGSLSVGDTIGSANAGSILFVGDGGVLAESNSFLRWNNSDKVFYAGDETRFSVDGFSDMISGIVDMGGGDIRRLLLDTSGSILKFEEPGGLSSNIGAYSGFASVNYTGTNTDSAVVTASNYAQLSWSDPSLNSSAGIRAQESGLILTNNDGSSTTQWHWPTTDGTTDYVLGTNGSGTLAWYDSASIASDQQLKSNITDLSSDVLSKLLNVRTVSYTLNSDQTNKTRIGFIAQDLEQYFPELVIEREDGYKAVYYAQMTAVITQAIKEMDLKLIGIQTLSDETFLSRIRNWFADAGNGIGSFIAGTIRAKDQLCVGNTCVTEDQLLQLLNNQNIQVVVHETPQEEVGSESEVVVEEVVDEIPVIDESPTEQEITVEEPVEEIIQEEVIAEESVLEETITEPVITEVMSEPTPTEQE